MVLHILELMALWCTVVSMYTVIKFKKEINYKTEDFAVMNFVETRESAGTLDCHAIHPSAPHAGTFCLNFIPH